MKPGDEAGGCVIQGLSSATLVEATTITMWHLWQDFELEFFHLALRFFLFNAKASSDASDNGPGEKYPNTTIRLTPIIDIQHATVKS